MKQEFLLATVILVLAEMVAANLTTNAQPRAVQSASEEYNAELKTSAFRRVSTNLASPLDQSYEDTHSILSGNNSCSSFFGDPHAAGEVLKHLVTRLEIGFLRDSRTGITMFGRFTYNVQPETGVEYRLFTRAIINVRGPFLKAKVFPAEPLVPRFGSFRPNTRQVRVLILLHELAHLIKGKDGGWLIPDDGHAPEISSRNTALIESHCRRQILSLTSAE